jgi:hypothetical protein
MSLSDLQADYDDEPRGNGVPFPIGVRIAAIIWMVFGGLVVAGILIAVVGIVFVAAGQGAAPNFCAPACVILMALHFLISGIQTFRGAAKSTWGNAVTSVFVGALCLAGAVAVFSGGLFPRGELAAIVLVGSIYSLPALALLVAGVLALIGNSAYEKWREAHGLNRPPPQSQEEKDYDDQLWQPDRDQPP